MEKKAISRDIRRSFFQFLQKQRDMAKSQHGECSSQYKHWLADSLTWKQFCESTLLDSSRLDG
jgi:hypothetical protein